MKLHFEDSLDYQKAAIDAVADLFKGQEICRTEFTVTFRRDDSAQGNLGMVENQLGVGNRLRLLDDEVLGNLKDVQLRNGLRPADDLQSGDFTVEMETGTGKTYVYLRTIFELNQRYGFTKFVIVVPSVAIKEGVYKTLQITREHFENLYPEAKGYEYFLYDSGKPGDVRNFATSSQIQIMVVTVGAINKKEVNNLYKENERTGGEKPIDLVRATNPVIIVDEPQTVDGGLQGQGKKALAEMNPLCTLRYSATHVDKHNMVYRLDAVDAYERGLVKQIEVASLEVDSGFNKPYVKLISTHNQRGTIFALVEIHQMAGGAPKPAQIRVYDGDDLEQVAGRDIYRDMRVGTITCGKGNETIEVRLPSQEDQVLTPGDMVGGVNADELKRLMIRRTIKEHLDKEMRFAAQKLGVKVLSLFFIDSVEFYRQYDENGQSQKGKYALMFEEEYRRLSKQPEYQTLFEKIDLSVEAGEVHEGYFSIDKKGKWTETDENNAGNRENAERAYNLIMKDKERLLSFDTKLKFIFSHSALKEGWDNPNVFQICNFSARNTERWRRQTIGRGLRLCVNQEGQRLRGFDINTLTVIADESYEDFAEKLQSEISEDTHIHFGVVEPHQFAAIPVTDDAGHISPLGVKASEEVWKYLQAKKLIDHKGKVQDELRTALKDGTFDLPDAYKAQLPEIREVLRKLAGKLDIKNADNRFELKPNKAVLLSEDFKALWERIKYKTTYRVDFDHAKLVQDAADDIARNLPPVTPTKARFRKADVSIGKGGVQAKETSVSQSTTIVETDIELPDLITDLQDKTQLKRKSIVNVLIKSQRLSDFRRNPQQFIDFVSQSINRTKQRVLVDGIRYQKLGEGDYYAQELFEAEELKGYLENTLSVKKSVYDYVVYDSVGIERNFAQDLEANEAVKLYAKLPAWFKVPTPLGNYNPDWAVLIETEGLQKLYFVVETKGSLMLDDLRGSEGGKIRCGEKHFDAIAQGASPARYLRATSVDDLMAHVD